MKINYLLLLIFISAVIYAGVDFSTGIVGTTHLNGSGCQCHNIDPDAGVQVWIEGPDSLLKGETAEYHIFLTGGPMVKGGFNVASRFSTLTATDPGTQIIAAELTHNQPRVFAGDTISWYFDYTAADSVNWDTLYSTANSVNGDGIPSNLDHWNFGANFPVRILDIVPVEFISFDAVNSDGTVILNWITATETNNKGFSIERKNYLSNEWTQIGFVQGKGTYPQKSYYSFSDSSPLSGMNHYRLKQLDFNGSYTYTNIIDLDAQPGSFSLEQNYPNPFNPTTTIRYQITSPGKVVLKVYDLTGREAAVLVNESQEAGKYSVEFNASSGSCRFASGVYVYKLFANNYTAAKKLVLLK
jgi:hypothetical protein